MNKRVVLSVAVNQNDEAYYVKFQGRLLRSLATVGGNPEVLSWTGKYPQGSPTHGDMPYGFKLYAIEEAVRRGFETVLWLDAGVYAIRNLDPLFEAIEDSGIYIVKDDNALSKFCSEETFRYFGIKREDSKDLTIACGAVLGFNFKKDIAVKVYSELRKAYDAGLYRGTYSRHSGMEDHRGDESILGILMNKYGVAWRTLKDHFCSDANPQAETILRSGYYERKDMPL